MRTTRNERRKAVTLIELLIVLAVIAVLASLLLPGLARAKHSARAVVCISNLKQQGIGLASFVFENSTYPLTVGNAVVDEFESSELAQFNHRDIWPIQINRQMGNNINTAEVLFRSGSIFRCPTDHRLRLKKSENPSYGYNAVGCVADINGGLSLGLSTPPGSTIASAAKESEVVRPSKMIAIADAFKANKRGEIDISALTIHHAAPLRPVSLSLTHSRTSLARQRHSGRLNALFTDGHVEKLKAEALLLRNTDEALSRWNKDHLPHREQLSN